MAHEDVEPAPPAMPSDEEEPVTVEEMKVVEPINTDEVELRDKPADSEEKKARRLSLPGGRTPRVYRVSSSDDEAEEEEEDMAVSVEVSASTDTEEKINRTIEQMKRELDTDNSDTDNYESLASEDNLTSVSSMDQYASCETLASIATITEDNPKSRPVSSVQLCD